MRILLAALALFIAVGAGAESLSQYLLHMAPGRHAGMLVWDTPGHEWLSMWVSDGTGQAAWRNPSTGQTNSVEHWRDGRDGYIYVDGYSDKFDVGVQFTSDCMLVQIIDLESGVYFQPPCAKGQIYFPALMPRGPWRLRFWGALAGTSRFYYEADFFPGEKATNNCWYEGPKTVDVLRQREVWYDSNGGWVRGTGNKSPFNAQGLPQDVQTTKTFEITLAKGYGTGWTGTDLATGQKFCLYSVWSW